MSFDVRGTGRAVSWAGLVYWALAVSYVLAFVFAERVYLQDYPDWVYQGNVLSRLVFGESLPHYQLKPYPVPNSTLTVLLAALSSAVGFVAASMLLVVLYVLASFWFVERLCSRFHPGTSYARALPIIATLFISSSFWNGYMAYQLALLLLVAFFVATEQRREMSVQLVIGFSVVLFFSHFVIYTVYCLYVGFRAWTSRSIRTVLALAPSLLLVSGYLLGRLLSSVREQTDPPTEVPGGILAYFAYKAYTLVKLGPFQSFLKPDGTSYLEGWTVVYLGAVLVSASFVATILLFALRDLLLLLRQKGWGTQPLVWWVLVLAALFLIAPPSFFGVVNVGERLAIPAFLVLLVWIRLPKQVLRGLVLIALLFSAYQLTFLFDQRNVNAMEYANRRRSGERYGATRQRYLSHVLYERAHYYAALENEEMTLPVFPSGMMSYRKEP